MSRKRKCIVDFYLTYPYKKNYRTPNNTVPVPFIKNSEVTNTDKSLDYKQYLEIITLFSELKGMDLVEGIPYIPKPKIGTIEFRKYKILDKHLVKYVKEWRLRNYFNNTVGQDRYCIKSTWERIKRSPVNRVSWRVKINQNLYRKVYEHCEIDYKYMFKFKDA